MIKDKIIIDYWLGKINIGKTDISKYVLSDSLLIKTIDGVPILSFDLILDSEVVELITTHTSKRTKENEER